MRMTVNDQASALQVQNPVFALFGVPATLRVKSDIESRIGNFSHKQALFTARMMIQVMSLRALRDDNIRFGFVALAVAVGNICGRLASNKANSKYPE